MDIGNQASQKVATKIGMKLIKRFEKNGTIQILYGKFKEESDITPT